MAHWLTVEDIMATTCKECGGIPDTAELPNWVFDEYDCCSCPVYNEDYDAELYECNN